MATTELQLAHAEIERLRAGITRLSKSQPNELIFPSLPLLPTPSPTVDAATVQCHQRCLAGMQATLEGYIAAKDLLHRKKRKRSNVTLTSSFDIQRNISAPEKLKVDAVIAKHAKAIFGADFVRRFATEPHLMLLLLDAPNIATTQALLQAFPTLARYSHRICIPQADPHHYSMMINHPLPCTDDTDDNNDTATLSTTTTTANTNTDATTPHTLHLNVRCQRLDQWLTSNRFASIQCPIFFADYETSVYGKPSYNFQPLVDLQRFLRCNYVSRKQGGCLLGVTLNFRTPNAHLYALTAPKLNADDVIGFVRFEATMQALQCEVLDVVHYGMIFLLFHLTEAGGAGGGGGGSCSSSNIKGEPPEKNKK